MASHDSDGIGLPAERIHRLTQPLARFLHVEAASGIVLLLCSVVALLLANSPWSDAYLGLWKTPVVFGIGSFQMDHSLQHWINDGLMAVFFFVIGLEVKREFVLGELSDLRNAALPIAGAIGGMVVPAGVYLALQAGEPAQDGWGIPMATDIAFVVGCMAVLGRSIPPSLRVVMLSVAIVDDIGAILVIAIGYTEHIDLAALLGGFGGLGLVLTLAWLGVRSVGVFAVVGAVTWLAFHESGIHATIAGVILGLVTPSREWISRSQLQEVMSRALDVVKGEDSAVRGTLMKAELAAREAISPLERLEALLHPWVGFFIMPIFALANAGVPIEAAAVVDPVALAIMAGLLVGKPVGILGASAIAVKFGIARMPDDLGWRALAGGSLLAGIGFTMALFIAGLALDGDALDAAKVGVLVGSVVCGALGMALLGLGGKAPEDG
jgi:NhaA family Na+:H+ antiporter